LEKKKKSFFVFFDRWGKKKKKKKKKNCLNPAKNKKNTIFGHTPNGGGLVGPKSLPHPTQPPPHHRPKNHHKKGETFHQRRGVCLTPLIGVFEKIPQRNVKKEFKKKGKSWANHPI